MTQGRTEEEVFHNIKEAIHLVLEATRQSEEIPRPVLKEIELEA